MEITDLMSSPPEQQTPVIDNPRAAYAEAIDAMVASVDAIDKTKFNERSSTAIDPAVLSSVKVVIIGAGGLGNWQWKTLLGMGFTCITIMDDDVVSPENVGPQAHRMIDIGLPKVEAIRQEAYAYKGVQLRAINARCPYTYSELLDMLGFVPDVVIGCTDNREWRNSFLRSITDWTFLKKENAPDLWIDLRMSLGLWDCYLLPIRNMSRARADVQQPEYWCTECFVQYRREANVSEEEAIQEPCTARAICFTGEGVAAHVGSILFNWYTQPKTLRKTMNFLRAVCYDEKRDGTLFAGTRKELNLPDCLRLHTQCDSVKSEYVTRTAKEVQLQEYARGLNRMCNCIALSRISYLSEGVQIIMRWIIANTANNEVIPMRVPSFEEAAKPEDKYFYFGVSEKSVSVIVPGEWGSKDWVFLRDDGVFIDYLPSTMNTMMIFKVKKAVFMAEFPGAFLSWAQNNADKNVAYHISDNNELRASFNGVEYQCRIGSIEAVGHTLYETDSDVRKVQDLNVGDRGFDNSHEEFIVVDKSNPSKIIVRYVGERSTTKMRGSTLCTICSV